MTGVLACHGPLIVTLPLFFSGLCATALEGVLSRNEYDLPFSGEEAAHLGREMAHQVRLYCGRESRTMSRRAYEHEHA